MTENQVGTHATFDDVHEGDTLTFLTRDTGFNGRGIYPRTGVVTKVTAKTVTVDCGPEGGGGTARIRRADWYERDVRREATADADAPTPYTADHVKILDRGNTVVALWLPKLGMDPQHAWNNLLAPEYRDVEVIATAERHFRVDGAAFSGWIVSTGPSDHTDPLRTKPVALDHLRDRVRRNFKGNKD